MQNKSGPSKSRERVTGKEQFYTPEDVAKHCVLVLDNYHLSDTYLEPAGGTGAFIKALHPRHVVSYDIEPKYNSIIQADFLATDISHLKGVTTITNPPFGRNHSLSVPFFNKCAEVSDYIGFIIPKSWRKWSVLNRLDTNFHLIHDEELKVNYTGGINTKLKTVFQIYERRDYQREIITVKDYGYIKKVKDPALADVALTIFGRGCGTVRTEFESKPKTTQMYLKITQPWVVDALRSLDYAKFYNNVAFTEALSIHEINYLLNAYTRSD